MGKLEEALTRFEALSEQTTENELKYMTLQENAKILQKLGRPDDAMHVTHKILQLMEVNGDLSNDNYEDIATWVMEAVNNKNTQDITQG